MTTLPAPDGGNESAAEVATVAETRRALIDRTNRHFTPLAKTFVQNPHQSAESRRGPLAEFVNNGDHRGLLAFLLIHAAISSGEKGWNTTLHLEVWARAFATTEHATLTSAKSAASKVLRRLEERHLIAREQSGRPKKIKVTVLIPDGTGQTYKRPLGDTKETRFIRLNHRFWTEGWDQKLSMPAIAMLLVALHEKPTFSLPTERMPEWYGWSADTAERGLRELQEHELLEVTQGRRKEPLAPAGVTLFNQYTLRTPFDIATLEADIAATERRGQR